MSRPTTSRRHFLATTALSSSALTRCSAAEEDPLRPIDAHVHVWTADTQAFPLADGFDRESMQPPSFTPEELLRHCRPAGVERIVLVQMNFYGFDNRYMLHVMRAHPGTFGGIAIVDHTQPGVAVRMRELAEQGVRGFRIYAMTENAKGLDQDKAMHEMWREAAEQGVAMCLLTDPAVLPKIHELCRRFPQTTVVIDHFARLGMRGPANPARLQQLLKLAEFEGTHVKVSAFYALGDKRPPYLDLAPMIRQLRDAYGTERLMWGSDCPYQVQGEHTYQASLSLLRDRLDFLTAAERRQLLETTAARLFF